MKLRTLLIVAIALAIVTSVGYYIHNASLTAPEDDPLIGTQIVDPNILKSVTKIQIAKEAEEVVLEVNDQGQWIVQSRYGLPIDFSKLNRMIRSLVDSKILRRITSREDRLARLGLTQGTVKFLSSEGKELVNLTYGKSLSGGGKAFIFGYEKTAFLSSESPSIDANSNNWTEKVLYKFEADDVAGIQFVLPEETWGVRRNDKDKDFVSTLPADARTPKQSDIKSLINRFTSLRFTEVSGRESESSTETWKLAADNERSLKFTLFSGETISVKMTQWDPPEPEGEDATATTESPIAYLQLSSSQTDHAINDLMDRLIFKASSHTFTGIPVKITEVADLPELEEEPEEETVAPEENSASESSESDEPTLGRPEIKQHLDGNSVISGVIPPKKEEDEEPLENAEDETEATTENP